MSRKFYLLPAPDTASFGPVTDIIPGDVLMSPQVTFMTAVGGGRVPVGESAEARLASATVLADYTPDATAPKPVGILNDTATRWNTWRAGPLSGVFPSGDWNLSLTVYTVSNNGIASDFSFFGMVNKSIDASGDTGLTTYSRFETERRTATLTATGVDRTGVLAGTWPAPNIELDNEYLFLSLAMKVHTLDSSAADRRLGLRVNASTFLETTDLQPLGVTLVGAVGI
jgi:hypothetical protein